MNEMSIYQKAKQVLAEYKRIDQVKDFRDKAMALRAYAKQAKDRTLEEDAIVARLRAERRLGEILENTERNKGGNPTLISKIGVENQPLTLKQNGIDYNLSQRAHALAKMPEADFEKHVEKAAKAPRSNVRKGTTAYGLILKDLMGIKRQLPKLLEEVAHEPDKKERTRELLQEIHDTVRDLLKELNSTGRIVQWSGH
jgi:hypothetical protein